MRALKFSSGAQWHVSQPTPVADFKWTDLQTEGVTALGRALAMVAEQLRIHAYRDEAGFQQVARDFWAMLRDEGEEAVRPHLREWLSEASQRGSGDDITAGILWRPVAAIHSKPDDQPFSSERIADEFVTLPSPR
ncbi:MAG: hypothetical protein P9E24_07965 [Candidatus Competibacter sp.]|nr:hypothetical protein [Candidatus Competibacter sp.]MDG4585236.1 hypothetical protein [Candidatus Competibacter sp.]